MTVTTSQVSWGSYGTLEGPAFYGRLRYNPQGELSFLEKAFLVTSCTEGALNSINMYDSCIMTVGAIQFCDRGSFAVCDMLGAVAEACGLDYLLGVLGPALKISDATFKKNLAGKWRFFLDGGRTEVNAVTLQQQLFLKGPGTKGTWTDSRRLHAKTWCAAMASVWEDQRAQQAQIAFTTPKLMQFVFGATKGLFVEQDVPNEGWSGMLRAAAVSYCINSPANVSKAISSMTSNFTRWSPEWCLDVLYAVTFVGVNTFQARYNSIRPVLEKQFGVTLPKTSLELAKKEWHTRPESIVERTPVVVEQPKSVTDLVFEKKPDVRPSVPPVDPPPEGREPILPVAPEHPNTKFTWILHFVVLMFGFWGRVIGELLKLLGRK